MNRARFLNLMIRSAAVLIWLAVCSPAIAANAEKLSGAQIVARLQAYYENVADYQVTFVQTTAHKMFSGRLQRAYGDMMYRKGGLMRWEYKRPERKFFIYDGKTLWVYEPDVPQVFAGTADAERLQRALAFLTGEGQLLNEYKVRSVDPKKLGFPQGLTLKLYPKDRKSSFHFVELYVNKTDFHVERSVVVDHEGNRNRIDLGRPSVNQQLGETLFQFTPPRGYR